jgi:hypothetical protein
MLKSKIIKWAIKQIVKDGSGSYGDMRYLEDVLENEWGEKMFIFSHRLVPVNKAKLDAANAKAHEASKNDPNAPTTMGSSGEISDMVMMSGLNILKKPHNGPDKV